MSADEPCMCGTDFTCMADEHDRAVAIIYAPDGFEPGQRVTVVQNGEQWTGTVREDDGR